MERVPLRPALSLLAPHPPRADAGRLTAPLWRLASHRPVARSAPGTPWTPQRQRDAETRGRAGVVDTLLYGARAERSDARDGRETDLGPVHALLRRACCGVVEASVAAVAAAAPPASKQFFRGDAVLADWRGRGTYSSRSSKR